MKISLCMIVKNEELVLERCLNSIKDSVDEIVIVDTGSTDKTKEIAFKFTDKVYDFEWIDDFAAARNFAFSKGNCDYLMWLDADDVFEKEDVEKIIEFKKNASLDVSIYTMRYVIKTDKNMNILSEIGRGRLFRKSDDFKWEGRVHEYIARKGKVESLDIKIYHRKLVMSDPRRNLRIYEKMLKDGIELNVRDTILFAKALFGDGRYTDAINEYKKVYNNEIKYVSEYDKYEAVCEIAYCYRLIRDLKASYEIITEYLTNNRGHSRIWHEYGEYFLKSKQYETAIAMYEEALRVGKFDILFDKNKEYEKFYPCISMSMAYYYLKDKENALKYIKLAEEVNSEADYVKNNKKLYENMS